MTICLTGFMGSGKTSVGKVLAKRLALPFIDLDDAIVASAGKTIPDIFSTEGEPAFRKLELETLRQVVTRSNSRHGAEKPGESRAVPSTTGAVWRGSALILALGGGTIMQPEAQAIIAQHCTCIYLRATEETIFRNLTDQVSGRPMLSGAAGPSGFGATQSAGMPDAADAEAALRKRISTLMEQRSSTYERTADLAVDTDGLAPDQVASVILAHI